MIYVSEKEKRKALVKERVYRQYKKALLKGSRKVATRMALAKRYKISDRTVFQYVSEMQRIEQQLGIEIE